MHVLRMGFGCKVSLAEDMRKGGGEYSCFKLTVEWESKARVGCSS